MSEAVEPIPADPATCERRLREGREQAARIIEAIAARGVAVELIGSIATGDVLPLSDIDFLVVSSGPMGPMRAIYEIQLLEETIPVDVMILELVPAALRHRLKRTVKE